MNKHRNESNDRESIGGNDHRSRERDRDQQRRQNRNTKQQGWQGDELTSLHDCFRK